MKFKPYDYYWVITDQSGYFPISTINYCRGDAIADYRKRRFGNKYTWKQLYRKGYRAVKVKMVLYEETKP